MSRNRYENLRALVVDDNRHMRTLLRGLLYALKFRRVFEATNGEEGLKLLTAEQPNLVITDYSMRPIDGIAFAKIVRQIDPPLNRTPIVMISGHTERRFVEEVRDAGIGEFLCKPITAGDLELRLAEIVERPRPFVKSAGFLGPDRRRHRSVYGGIDRRRRADADSR